LELRVALPDCIGRAGLSQSMDIRNLRLFLEVASNGSVLRTATQLAISPSSVSKAITTLERELSTRLFERTGRGVVMTPAGLALQPRAEAVLAAMDGIQDCLGAAGAPVAGVVQLGIQPSVSWPLVADLLDQLGRKYPGISLDVFEGTAHQIDEWLAEGRCDVGLLSRRPSTAHADSEELLQLPLLLIGPSGSAETAQATISFARVARLPLLLANAPSGARPLLEEHARQRNLTLNVVHNINSAHLKRQLVARGHYFTVATAWTNAPGQDDTGLSAARIVEPDIALRFHLAVGGRRKPPDAVQIVTDMVRTLACAAAAGQA
jgi:LysR family transcriptional regulator, nitrogen assimilation regulatory protein